MAGLGNAKASEDRRKSQGQQAGCRNKAKWQLSLQGVSLSRAEDEGKAVISISLGGVIRS